MATKQSEPIESAVEATAAAVANATDGATQQIETTEQRAQRAVKKAVAQATEAVETVEVKVHEIVNNASTSSTWLVDGFRRIALASIGAVAMTIDEAEGLVNKLVERGELAQKDGQKLLSQIQSRVSGSRSQAPFQVEQVSDRIEHGVEEILSRLNVASKRDIDDLSARIAQLTAKIEEMKKK